MQAINHTTANLEVQLQKLLSANEIGGIQLTVSIQYALLLLQDTKNITRALNNSLLNEFLNANTIILQQLQQVSQTLDANNPLIIKSSDVMLQLTHMYQDAIVPLLTRLHNLSNAEHDIHRITSITSLGNEINTCSGQINQFNEKFNVIEKIYTMLGILLMLSSISMMVAIISKPSIEIPLLTPLTILTLGCSICKKIMEAHLSDPGSDLITTSIKKIEPLILDVAKDFAEEEQHPQNQVILQAKPSAKTAKKAKSSTEKNKAPKQAATAELESESMDAETTATIAKIPPQIAADSAQPTGTFLEKIKGVLDLFTNRK